MFLVMEIQKDENGSLSWLVTQHSDLRDALSKYHTVLGFAAKSGLPRHGATIIYEDGHVVEPYHESYTSNGEDI